MNPRVLLAPVLLAGCLGPDANPRHDQSTGTGVATSTGLPGETSTGVATGTAAGSPTSTSTGPQCYTLQLTQLGEWTLARVPDTDGPPVPIQSFQIVMEADMWGVTPFDGRWWVCGKQALVVLDTTTGQATRLPFECGRIAAIGTQLAIDHYLIGQYSYYDSAQDVVAGTPSAVVDEPWDYVAHIGVDGNTLYTGWFAADRLRVVDVATDDESELILEGYDTSIWGIGVLGSTVRVLDDGRQDDHSIRVRDFDQGTGEQVGSLIIGTYPFDIILGLWCGFAP